MHYFDDLWYRSPQTQDFRLRLAQNYVLCPRILLVDIDTSYLHSTIVELGWKGGEMEVWRVVEMMFSLLNTVCPIM